MLRASCGLPSSRSLRFIGSPERQITRVRPVLPTPAWIASSISTLSRSASTTIALRPRDSLAMTSSPMIENTFGLQPRMRV